MAVTGVPKFCILDRRFLCYLRDTRANRHIDQTGICQKLFLGKQRVIEQNWTVFYISWLLYVV